MSDELEGFLNAEPEVEPEVTEEAVTEETTEEEPTGEEEGSPPEPEKAQTNVPITALLDEREKRQALQRQLEALQQQQPQTEAPDVIEDQEGFAKHVEERVVSRVSKIEAAFNLKLARIQYPDFDEKAAIFQEMADKDPSLGSKAMAAENIPEFAYRYVVEQERAAKLNDPNYEAQLKEKLKQEVLAELKAGKAAELKAEIDKSVPPSLSTKRAAGGNSNPALVIPDPLETTFNR